MISSSVADLLAAPSFTVARYFSQAALFSSDLVIFAKFLDFLDCSFAHMILSQIHTVTVLCVVLKQGVCPSRTFALFVDRVRSRRCGTTPDGGATGRVGDIHSVAEQLGYEFRIRSLAAAGAGAGEFKQRLFELAALDGGFFEFLSNFRFRVDLLTISEDVLLLCAENPGSA